MTTVTVEQLSDSLTAKLALPETDVAGIKEYFLEVLLNIKRRDVYAYDMLVEGMSDALDTLRI